MVIFQIELNQNLCVLNVEFRKIELKSAFGMLDANHDGKLNPDEIRSVVKRLNMDLSEYDLNELVSSLDQDNDGKVDFEGT